MPHPHYHYSPVDQATLEAMIAGSWWRRLSADRQVSPRFASRWRLQDGRHPEGRLGLHRAVDCKFSKIARHRLLAGSFTENRALLDTCQAVFATGAVPLGRACVCPSVGGDHFDVPASPSAGAVRRSL